MPINFQLKKKPKEEKTVKEKTSTLKLKGKGKLLKNEKTKTVSKQLIVFDIGSKTTKLIVGKYKDGILFIDSMDGAINYKDCVFDGKIIDQHGIYAIVKELLSNNFVKIKDVVITVDSTEILRREMDVADVPKEDLLGLVTYEMGQYLPIDISSYVMQVKYVQTIEREGLKKIKVSVGAVPKNIIEGYVSLTDSAFLDRYGMDINSNSLEKLINLEIERNPHSEFRDRNMVFIDMGHSFFNIIIFGNGKYLFNKIIEIGGSSINNIIAERMGVSEDEAESIKINNGTNYSVLELIYKFHENPEPRTSEEYVLRDTLSVYDAWASEINQVLKYYTTRNRNNIIDGICLFGGCSFINGIDEYLEKKLQLPTRAYFDFRCIKLANRELNENVLNYLNAIGALIRSENK